MDCGPACLKSVMEGYGLQVSYPRLREACQTDIDGTSINSIEETAQSLGLHAEQVMVPPEHLFADPEHHLPAIVVVALPNGNTHFVVCWRKHGQWLQIMDPARGRAWVQMSDFRRALYIHQMQVDREDWFEWTRSEDYRRVISNRMQALGLAADEARQRIDRYLGEGGWPDASQLDRALRVLESVQESTPRRTSRADMLRTLDALMAASAAEDPEYAELLEQTRRFATVESADEPDALWMRGMVMVRISGVAASAADGTGSALLDRALEHRDPSAWSFLWRAAERVSPGLLGLALAGSVVKSLGLILEALVLYALIGVQDALAHGTQRAWFGVALLALVLAIIMIRLAMQRILFRVGRGMELHVRQMLSKRLQEMGDQFFSSRLKSDMAERAHVIYRLRFLPGVVANLIHFGTAILLTGFAVAWLAPGMVWVCLGLFMIYGALPWLVHPLMVERDMRARTHNGALSNFYMDALIGLKPLQAHAAQAPFQASHETQLVAWSDAEHQFLSLRMAFMAVQAILGTGLIIYAVVRVSSGLLTGTDATLLLIVYWLLDLAVQGTLFTATVQQLPMFRNIFRRLDEFWSAPSAYITRRRGENADRNQDLADLAKAKAFSVSLNEVRFSVGGHTILDDVSLEIAAGEHVAIVGASGSGKSTLAGMVLGWGAPERGTVKIHGREMSDAILEALRRRTAWIDPTVHLWNASIIDNLSYGAEPGNFLAEQLAAADLLGVVSRLPEGLKSSTGDEGRLLSGGEGQRVRIGRGIGRPHAACVILDEPFRGLDRSVRRELKDRLRAHWQHSTLVFITHDVSDTLDFDRVITMHGGRCVEIGKPSELAQNAESIYRSLLDKERELFDENTAFAGWKTWQMTDGRLTEVVSGP